MTPDSVIRPSIFLLVLVVASLLVCFTAGARAETSAAVEAAAIEVGRTNNRSP
jgi:hypothetical protein